MEAGTVVETGRVVDEDVGVTVVVELGWVVVELPTTVVEVVPVVEVVSGGKMPVVVEDAFWSLVAVPVSEQVVGPLAPLGPVPELQEMYRPPGGISPEGTVRNGITGWPLKADIMNCRQISAG